jgi:hypothetical protein
MHLLRRFSLGVNNLQLSYSKSMVYLQEISWTSEGGFFSEWQIAQPRSITVDLLAGASPRPRVHEHYISWSAVYTDRKT